MFISKLSIYIYWRSYPYLSLSYQVAPRQEDSDNEDDVDEDEEDDEEEDEEQKKGHQDKTEEERRKEEYGAEDDIEYVLLDWLFLAPSEWDHDRVRAGRKSKS